MIGGTDQSGSDIGGDQVGRDKVTYNVGQEFTYVSSISAFADIFREEIAEDPGLGVVIEALQHYLDSVDPEPFMGLAEKLRKAGREDFINEAERLKELFHKKLFRRQFSPKAQEVFAFLLGSLHQRFRYKVRPLIEQEKSSWEVDEAVFEHVIQPVSEIVSQHGIPVHPQEVEGMLYFLTGNCHIKWHKNARVSSSA